MNMTLYSIGEFAKLKRTSIETLRHYDRIGLLQPEHIDESSSYRFYSYKQILRYDMITCCKDIGMSLQEIKQVFEHKDPSYFQTSIDVHRKQTRKKIAQLQKSIRTMDLLHTQMDTTLSLPNTNDCYLRVLPQRTYVMLPCGPELPREQLEVLYTHLIDQISKHHFTTMYAGGFLYEVVNRSDIHCVLFECIQEQADIHASSLPLFILPAGKYFCKKHTHDTLRDDLKEFLSEIEKQPFVTTSIIDAYLIEGHFQSELRSFELQAFIEPVATT